MIQFTHTLHFSSFLITLTVSEQPLHSTVGKILLHPSPGPLFSLRVIVPFKNMMDPARVVLSRSDRHHSITHFQTLTPICSSFFHQLRILLHRAGNITATITPVSPLGADPALAAHISPSTDSLPPSLGDPIPLFLDSVATPSSLFTATKTTNRGHYSAARARLGLPETGGPADVLLWNTKGMITESSVRNVAFFRHGRWITPHDSTGCLPGVMRRWLLEQRLVATDDQGWLTRNNVQEGELVLIFNAVEGCRIAIAHPRRPEPR